MSNRLDRSNLWVIFSILLLAPVMALGSVIHERITGQSIVYLIRDTTAVSGSLPSAGAYSNIGIGAWVATAAICLFAAFLHSASGDTSARSFFAASAALTGLFALDDRFLLHESLPSVLHVIQWVWVGVYGLLVAAWLIAFRRRLLSRDSPLIMLAIFLLLASVAIDQLDDIFGIGSKYLIVLEDVSKYLGIAFWAAFLVRAAYQSLVSPRQLLDSQAQSTNENAV